MAAECRGRPWCPVTGRRLSKAQQGWRDATLLLAGLGLTGYEAVFYRGPERWGLIMLYAGMMGLTVFLRADEKRQPDVPNPPPVHEDSSGVS